MPSKNHRRVVVRATEDLLGRPTPRRPTLKDVAEASGFGLRTTKKVMSGGQAVPEATRDAILAAAQTLGYEKNLIASALALSRNEKIAIIYTETTKNYFPEVEAGFRRFAEARKDYGFESVFVKGTDASLEWQANALKAALDEPNITGVLLQPISFDGLDPWIADLVDAGKPVITFGSDAPNSARQAYIGPDAYKAGRIGGQVLGNYVGRAGRVLVASRAAAHMQTKERRRGFLDVVTAKFPGIEPIDLFLHDDEETYEAIRAAIQTTEYAGIFITYADASDAGRALKDLGMSNVVLVGFDSSIETLALLQEGFVDVILEQNPDLFCYEALEMMFNLRYHGTKPPSQSLTEVAILTGECLGPTDDELRASERGSTRS